MERLVPVLNQLQSVLGILGAHSISLPQLVVVGSQSSGKSSVLENIVGRDFLPRGNNIVTRRPLILQLINTDVLNERDVTISLSTTSTSSTSNPRSPRSERPEVESKESRERDIAKDTKAEWGEFNHIDKKFYDFSAIKAEITKETERLTGRGTAISTSPIFLRIYSPHIPTLTLVDLPGITKVATGDQPQNIEQQLRKMILHFISNPNSIIVAVSSATEDISNSEALKIARDVDPSGSRTIGVLTKLDLMDPGTDASAVLLNQIVPLQLGYVGVVNRGQRDIQENVPIHAALAAERNFFEGHTTYRTMSSRIGLGTAFLSSRLSSLLLGHLQTYLPVIRQQILVTVQETEKELDSYGNPLGIEGLGYSVLSSSNYSDFGGLGMDLNMGNGLGVGFDLDRDRTEEEREALRSRMLGPMLLELLSKFAAHYVEALEGRSATALLDSSRQELFGGARIAYVFHDIFGAAIDSIDPFEVLSDADIRAAIRNATGPRPTLFLPEMSFEMLVKKQIERLRQPCITCVDMVLEELQRVALQCEASGVPQLARFPALREAMLSTVRTMLIRRVTPAKSMVQNLVNIELAYINTNHPDFIGGSRALTKLALIRRKKQDQAAGSGSQGRVQNMLGVDIPEGASAASTTSNQPISSSQGQGAQGSLTASSSNTPSPELGLGLGNINGSNGDYPNDLVSQFRYKDPSERELIETDVIKLLISSYFAIVKKTIKDTIPKAVMLLLVNKTKQDIQSELVNHLYKEDQFARLLKEADDISEKRESCMKLIMMMRRALEIVNQIKDISKSAN